MIRAARAAAAVGWSIGRLHDDELVAADAGDHVAPSSTALQALRHRLQQLVADRWSERVVDLLEAVDVEHEHYERGLAGPLRSSIF